MQRDSEEQTPDTDSNIDAGDLDRPAKKSRGGRKLIYATLEQRKQRNRDAQAAFRERRTEHIAELERTVQEQKTKLQASQTAHTRAKDECLLLRYKNSLLERILLEKGIDVNAELNSILEVRPQKPSISERQEDARQSRAGPSVGKKASSTPHSVITSQALPSPKSSSCCAQCSASHAQEFSNSQTMPPSNVFSPALEDKMRHKPVLRGEADPTQSYPYKRRRYCGQSSDSGTMQRHNMHQSYSYPQAGYRLGKYHLFRINLYLKNFLILD